MLSSLSGKIKLSFCLIIFFKARQKDMIKKTKPCKGRWLMWKYYYIMSKIKYPKSVLQDNCGKFLPVWQRDAWRRSLYRVDFYFSSISVYPSTHLSVSHRCEKILIELFLCGCPAWQKIQYSNMTSLQLFILVDKGKMGCRNVIFLQSNTCVVMKKNRL